MRKLIDEEPKESPGNTYTCPVHLIREADGGYSVLAANLPGVASQGDSEQEALTNIIEALVAALSVYDEEGGSIPWLDTHRLPAEGALIRWVSVHV